MNKKLIDGIAIASGIATVAGVMVAIYYGNRTVTEPGVVVEGIAPEDEIESLAERGYNIDSQSFYKAVTTGDKRSIRLFCDADILPIVDSHISFIDANPDQETFEVLRDCSAVDLESVCDLSEFGRRYDGKPTFPYRQDIIEPLCGEDIFQAASTRFEAATDEFDRRIKESCLNETEEFKARVKERGGLTGSIQSDFIFSEASEFGMLCQSLGVPLAWKD